MIFLKSWHKIYHHKISFSSNSKQLVLKRFPSWSNSFKIFTHNTPNKKKSASIYNVNTNSNIKFICKIKKISINYKIYWRKPMNKWMIYQDMLNCSIKKENFRMKDFIEIWVKWKKRHKNIGIKRWCIGIKEINWLWKFKGQN